MNKYEITKRIETFAPTETAEPWDCVGFMVETNKTAINKIMLCLTPTQDIINQAREQNCDMIISHHPLFYVPIDWSDIDIYSAHTNLDRAHGGTTDTIIKNIRLQDYQINIEHDFLRFVDLGITVEEFIKKLSKISPNLRYTNKNSATTLKRIAFCAGSGSEFIKDAQEFGADALVTGDLKFHTALDSEIAVFDIGHFESEIIILPILKNIIGKDAEIIFAKEHCPFVYI